MAKPQRVYAQALSAVVVDPEMAQFEKDLLESIGQAQRGEYAAVHTPEMIMARRKPGRPMGAIKPDAKVQTAIRFDPEVLEGLRASGKGWQTRVNDVMREWLRSRPAA